MVGQEYQILVRFGISEADAPVANRAGVGESVARYSAAEAHVLELLGLSPQTRSDIAQTLPRRQLRESHSHKLIDAGETFDLVLSVVAPHAATEGMNRQMLHQPHEDELSGKHLPLRHRRKPKGRKVADLNSSR